MKKNILVFPCGSEIGLEIHRSLKYSAHVNLIGASSIDDHGSFVYKNYINGVPFIDDINFIESLKYLVEKHKIDAIYPAMDKVISIIKNHEEKLGCLVISSPKKTTDICLSKRKTYQFLMNEIKTPIIYDSIDKIVNYPVFLKPNIGYGSRGVKLAHDKNQVLSHIRENTDILMLEFLPGQEYTVDCFTNSQGALLFVGPRERSRITNGISVNTSTMNDETNEFIEIANKINNIIKFQGAWFFQVKRDIGGKLTLMEIASRLGGSSAVYRNDGVNFALLSIFDAFGHVVKILNNTLDIELDRALSNKYKIKCHFDAVYVDFDDCLVIDNKINETLIAFLYQEINKKKEIILITKHEKNIYESLSQFRISNIFDQVIHIGKEDEKFIYIKHKAAIFIDDSHQERSKIKEKLGIPTFSPDMIEGLLEF